MSDVASGSGATIPRDPLAIATAWREQIARHWSTIVPIVTSVIVAIFVGWALVLGGAVLSLVMSALPGRRLAQTTR
jgi:hypothetical protein